MIRVKRAYDELKPDDGMRVLVDRLWPRGKRREDLSITRWFRDLAPSGELRRWFAHSPERWPEFKNRYFDELDKNRAAWQPLLETARSTDVTLVYGARDREHNNAVALKDYLERKLRESRKVAY
jgi:uncharacterized protein YeaO (DUF488 family)